MDFSSAASLLAICKEGGVPISQAMIDREVLHLGGDIADTVARMEHSYDIMKSAVHSAITEEIHSIGGLIGGEGKKLNTYRQSESKPLCGPVISKAIAYAMGVLEVNASMGLIVAAPTAGSSGVIPGVFVALQEEYSFSDAEMVKALFNAGAIGYLITRNATVAGAEGGCQAEVGAASAMAAAALVDLKGGTAEQCAEAFAMALTNLEGLVCDPVAGLVEIPCVKRNVIGAMNAVSAADMALAGIVGHIPADEVIDAMAEVGNAMSKDLRETGIGGLAGTPTGCKIAEIVTMSADTEEED